MKRKAKGGGREARGACVAFAFAICLFTFALPLAGCIVDERRAVPAEAQAAIDRVTEDIAAGRDEKVYAEAAEEWRARVSVDENKKILEQARARLGRVSSRALHSGSESGGSGGGTDAAGRTTVTSSHSLVVTYQTTFERGTAMETFMLLERDGRWLLAGYSVSSNALK